MFCPECKSEYRTGFTRCEECDVDLVEQLPSATPEIDAQAEPVTVFVTFNDSEANLVKSLLEGSGIEVLLFDENLSSIDPPAAFLIGGIKVAVPKRQETLALEVLREYRSGAGREIVGETQGSDEYRCPHCLGLLEPETTVCPKCGSQAI